MKKQNKTHIAFNTHLFLPLLLIVCFSGFSFFSAVVDHNIEFAIGFALFIPFCLFAILISPIYIVFSDEDVKIIYTLGQKEIIKWKDVRNIYTQGNWIGGGGPPHYVFAYPNKEKRAFFVRGEIPKTRITTKLIKKYYKRKIST